MTGIDTYLLELRRTRALAQLRMYEGLLNTLSGNVAYAKLLRDACGIDPSQWEVLDIGGREYVIAQGRLALLKAARTSRRVWEALPPYSPQRSDVLLRGARVLGIETTWAGWAGAE
jgi:hypothetical protein